MKLCNTTFVTFKHSSRRSLPRLSWLQRLDDVSLRMFLYPIPVISKTRSSAVRKSISAIIPGFFGTSYVNEVPANRLISPAHTFL